jgi:hypothetical protein
VISVAHSGGKADENAVAHRIAHVNHLVAIHRHPLRVFYRIFLEREQRRSLRIEFVDVPAARVHDVDISNHVGRNADGIVELSRPVAVSAPRADEVGAPAGSLESARALS